MSLKELQKSIMSNPEISKLCRSYLYSKEDGSSPTIIIFKPTSPNFLTKLSVCRYPFQTKEEQFIIENIIKTSYGLYEPDIKNVKYSELINTIRRDFNGQLVKTSKDKFECAYADIEIPTDLTVQKHYICDMDTYKLKFDKKEVKISTNIAYTSFYITVSEKRFIYRIENKEDYNQYVKLVKYIEGKAFC